MLRIAVLDDQQEYLELVETITQKSLSKQGISYELFQYTFPGNLLHDIEEDNKYDIYLLDVELSSISGLEVAREIRKKYYAPVIIYITNYVEYAIEAYEVNAYRYIPKKLLEEKLPEAYEAICPEIIGKAKNYYIIEKNHQLEKIKIEDIYYVKKDDKYILIIHKDGQSRERITISEFFESVKKYDLFIVVDRSYVVNSLHIKSLREQQVFLRDETAIPVSRPRLSRVKREIMRLWTK